MRSAPLLRFLALACLGALLLVLLAPGCGRSSLEPESLRDGGTSAVCSPSTCPNGCCDANGACRTGRDVRACGSIGGRCSDCVANGFTLCNSARVCGREDAACSAASCPSGCCTRDEGRLRCLAGTEPAACGRNGAQCTNCATEGRTCAASSRTCGTARCTPANCTGCCVGDQCLPGDATTACGARGAQCDACAAGQSCRGQSGGGGQCEGTAACGPANCGGCCNAAGQCVAGNDTTACGKQGERCAACGVNQVCVRDGLPNARTCQVPSTCGPSNCPGCCVNNQCVVATTPQACGTNGQVCKGCQPGQVCNATGECVTASEECNTLTCPGCCIGDICAVGTFNTACGTGGQLCTNCANQVPPRVCQGGTCQQPTCGPANCQNGCCSGNTCVLGTQDGACGPTGGGACTDCTDTGQVCQNRACANPCSIANCPFGCCLPNNTCSIGTLNSACGSGGNACGDCTLSGSFCNGLVIPRRCNDQQSTCPAAYPGCPGGTTLPVITAFQGVCSDAALAPLVALCAGGPDTLVCTAALAALPQACSTCLNPFKFPFEQNIGLWACAVSMPGIDAACRGSAGCAANCAQTSCNQCLPSSETSCHALVNGGVCAPSFNAAQTCTAGPRGSGICSPISYANYGAWLRGVGDHFCGNGP